MLYTRATSWLLLVVGAMASVGCSREVNGLAAVHGRVNFQQQPLDRGAIEFLHADGTRGRAGGAMILDGRFEMPQSRGLPPGTYRISISSPEAADAGPSGDAMLLPGATNRERIPAAFNTESTTVVDVSAAGPNEFLFDVP